MLHAYLAGGVVADVNVKLTVKMNIKKILASNLQPEKEKISDKDWEFSSLLSNLKNFNRNEKILRERTPISHQGELLSCTSNATCDAFEYISGDSLELSRLFVYWNSRSNKKIMSGTSIRSALDSLRQYGVCSEDIWPYDPQKVNIEPSYRAWEDASSRKRTTYYRVKTQEEIIAAIDAGWPLIFSIPLDDEFLKTNPEKDYIFTGDNLSNSFHTMVIVGYRLIDGECHLRVRNSWGKEWGDQGYCWFSSRYFMRSHQDCWAVTNYTPREHLLSKRNVEVALFALLTISLSFLFYHAANTNQINSSMPGILTMASIMCYGVWRRFKLNVTINDKMPFGQ